MFSMSLEQKLGAIPEVVIDFGTFKYIQIKVSAGGKEKIVVRGLESAEYHADILDSCAPQIRSLGFQAEAIGGGRIKHDPAKKRLDVYGYSMGFGRADHRITVKKLEKAYPDYSITWSNEGY
ncbi:14 kDa phosphohistidine phosphatase-like [Clavelina lepadiformis]|uniref:14 kDa phosphohistidine phosphatase-like n=1 Tax=Clavelina lepadiformis TaxID=159417 RepID=UPI0040410F6A